MKPAGSLILPQPIAIDAGNVFGHGMREKRD